MSLMSLFRKQVRPHEQAPLARGFSLTVAGYGVEATPLLPVGVAHLPDHSLMFGPMNGAAAEPQMGPVGDGLRSEPRRVSV